MVSLAYTHFTRILSCGGRCESKKTRLQQTFCLVAEFSVGSRLVGLAASAAFATGVWQARCKRHAPLMPGRRQRVPPTSRISNCNHFPALVPATLPCAAFTL
eukprot:365558-Chlamydomonas_euryale.AAC.23